MEESGRVIAFPRIARYNAAIKYIIEAGTGVTCLLQPELTKRSLDLGTKYSPDYVCSPFKTTLGSMIEALEAGADTIVMTHGFCRLGYYGELQEQIMRDLGYQFDFINLAEYMTGKIQDIFKAFKRISPKMNLAKFALAVKDGLQMGEYIDNITELYYKNCGFEVTKGQYKKIFDQYILEMETVSSRDEIAKGYQKAKQAMLQVPLDKPDAPLRVGIVGEFYTVMDAFSNLEIEQHLADMGVEVYRWMNIKNRMLHYSGEKNMNVKIKDLCTYEMGPTSTANIWAAKDYAEKGFDGIIHVKGAACTPEIDVMPVLQNIGADYKIPILYLTYDSQTSDVGMMTRLEAFYDMIQMRKKIQV